jgi:V8-like Glu-specific endopeptidase
VSGGSRSVAEATAALFVQGRRVGSAVLVDARHLVTAGHVLFRSDPDSGVKAPVGQVDLEFPPVTVQPARMMTAYRRDLGSAGDEVDVAVLDLSESMSARPRPVEVWPAERLPERVEVFGYPLAERPLNGVWRVFKVAGPTAAGTVQLDWTAEAGTLKGQSGGPVIDAETKALVGILVEGSSEGRFDRFLPVTVIRRVWAGMSRPWLFAGGTCFEVGRRR